MKNNYILLVAAVALMSAFSMPSHADEGYTSAVGLIAKADVAAGKAKAQVCVMCHTFEKDGAKKVGPNLWNIVNAHHAHEKDFMYSGAMESMAKEGDVWDYGMLDNFLYSPKDHAPGTKMPFAGIKDNQERANVIAYLRTLSDHPAPLPKSK